MTPTTNQGGDPSAADIGAEGQGADQATDQQSGGFVVCIAALPDGTYQIYSQDSDDDQDDAGAQGASGGSDDNTQTADNVDDALQIAKMMLEQEADEDSGAGGDENAMLSPDDAKAAWNQMAAKRDKKRSAGM